MQVNDKIISTIVSEVVSRLQGNAYANSGKGFDGRFGIFTDPKEAVAAAAEAFERIQHKGIAARRQAIDIIRALSTDNAVEFGTMEMSETKVGRLDHKIEKQRGIGYATPGIEYLKSDVFSGDNGLTVIEHAPFGVIAVITPVTHSLPTITCNAIMMLAAGNTLVINPHPSGKRIACEGVRRYNEAIYKAIGIDNLITIIANPTFESADVIFKAPEVKLISVTGGPGVAQAALAQTKRAIVSGPGNPPVVIDETADLDKAARSIIFSASYDNNLLCLAEKEVFVVESVFDQMMDAMVRAGAVRFNAAEVDAITNKAIGFAGEGAARHPVPSRDFLGQSPYTMGKVLSKSIDPKVDLIFGETDEDNPFVTCEQMMPFLPFVSVKDVEEGIAMACKYEHGFHHTAIMHSKDVTRLTMMGKAVDTTIFVKNGPATAGLGLGGEGTTSYSIAGVTGEGITTPMTYTRSRRCTLCDSLHILEK